MGGNFAVNSYLQFENYPSITGLVALGFCSAFKYEVNDRNSFLFSAAVPLVAYGVRPSYAGCDALLMKYAEEDFMKILTVGEVLSVHNYQSIQFSCEYQLRAAKHFSVGLGGAIEYIRIDAPKGRPFYMFDGSIKTVACVKF